MMHFIFCRAIGIAFVFMLNLLTVKLGIDITLPLAVSPNLYEGHFACLQSII